jgi:microcystin degradation protein MlrC
VVDILRQGTDDEPMAGLLAAARAQQARPGVLSVSVVEGFPYADVPEMGMSFLAVTDGDAELAKEVADTLAGVAWSRREEFVGGALEIDDALRRADRATAWPVLLLDVGDNVGGGSPGDSTYVLHAARRLGIGGVAQTLCDPEVVRTCAAAGAGARVEVAVGGKADDRHGDPLRVKATVTAVTDGRFEDPTPTHSGTRFFDVGPTVGLRTDDDFDLVVTSRPDGTWSLGHLRVAGVEPTTARIIVAKGVHAPRAAFGPIAAQLLWLATPGSTAAELSTFEYVQRRRPLYPFEPDTVWEPR